jgi:hypothetical protein
MVVAKPVRRSDVDFHVANPQLSVNPYFRIEEIRASPVVVETGVDHLDGLSVSGGQCFEWENLVFPDVVYQLFHIQVVGVIPLILHKKTVQR